MAKLLFPREAKVAMDIAQVDGTDDFLLTGMNKNITDAQRTGVDLNESPFKIKDEHLNRLRALSKTGTEAFCVYLSFGTFTCFTGRKCIKKFS